MKKLIFSAACLLAVAGGAMAQSPIRWSVDAGLNLSKATGTSKTDCGFNIGVTGEYSLSSNVFLDAALKLSSQPWTRSATHYYYDSPEYETFKEKMTPYSLMLPIHIGYGFKLGAHERIYAAVGPYVGYGLFGGGRVSHEVFYDENNPDKGGTWDISNPYGAYMRRFQVGVDAQIGFVVRDHYKIGFGYQRQLNNMLKRHVGEHAQTFSINVGYVF
ncbi:MAG: PorT family protein [Staphylococcus sp.]|nr:PorT family protein [Staphylococcus sp.]